MKSDSKAEDSDDNARPAIHEIPHDGITRGDRKKTGRIVMHVVVSCYCFLMLAVICDEYFFGSIEILCQSS